MRYFWPLLVFAGPALAEPVAVIDTATCRLLERHQPAPDVAYRPGVDVQGNAVAPADLPAERGLNLPQTVAVDIRIPVRKLLGRATPPLTGDADIRVGQVLVGPDGRVTFNGREIGDGPVIAACRAAAR
jgi:hypothetical protein